MLAFPFRHCAGAVVERRFVGHPQDPPQPREVAVGGVVAEQVVTRHRVGTAGTRQHEAEVSRWQYAFLRTDVHGHRVVAKAHRTDTRQANRVTVRIALLGLVVVQWPYVPVQLVDHAAAATTGHHDMVAHRLARLGVQHRGLRVTTNQGVGVGHVGVGYITKAQAIGAAEWRVGRHAEAQPQRFGLVVDRHVAVVLRITGSAVAFGIDAFYRTTIGPAHVQCALPHRDEVAVVRLAADLHRGLGTGSSILGPGGALRQDAHGAHQAFLRLLDEV